MIGAAQWALILGGILTATAGGLILKLGARELPQNASLAAIGLAAAVNPKIILGFVLYFVPALCWIYLLRRMELSLLQPLFSLIYVFTPIAAYLFLKEDVSLVRGVGIAIIVAGVVVVSRG